MVHSLQMQGGRVTCYIIAISVWGRECFSRQRVFEHIGALMLASAHIADPM